MKRFLSMILTLALVLTSLFIPVYADEAAQGDTPGGAAASVAVDITSINDGDTYTAGSNISLAADASTLADVKNIDFFANGTKLPGTIVGNTGKIIWYAPSEGVYDITTQVTYTSEAAAPGNETVKVTVLPAATDLHMLWPGDYGITIPQTTESTEYAVYGKSAMITLPAGDTTLTIDMKDTAFVSKGYTGILVYAPETIEGASIFKENNNTNSSYMKATSSGNARRYNASTDNHQGITKGFNRYVCSTWSTSKDTGFNTLYLKFFNVPEGNTTPIYICGIYEFVNETPVAPVATAVLDGKEAVCNEVGTFRIDLDGAIFPYATTTPVAVKKVDGETETDVDIKGYKLGSDYVDVYLSTLELESTYKVSVLENTLIGTDSANSTDKANAMVYVPATDFTFTTKDTDCENATPVVKMSYPAAGETCLTDTGFAAKLVSGSSAISDVNFYKTVVNEDNTTSEELIGAGTLMSDGEYWIKPSAAALEVGVATEITVKALDADGGELATASATYTGAETPSYFIEGMGEGDVIILAEEPSRNIKVIDSVWKNYGKNFTTSVSKIEIYNNDVLLETLTGTYVYELKFDKVGDNKLTVKVYDDFGTVHPFEFNYCVIDGVKIPGKSYSLDFEGLTMDSAAETGTIVTEEQLANMIATNTNLYTDGVFNDRVDFSLATMNNSQALRLVDNGTGTEFGLIQEDWETGHKVHYFEFDLMTESISNSNGFAVRPKGVSSGTSQSLFGTSDYDSPSGTTGRARLIPANKMVHVTIILDYNYATDAEGNYTNKPTAIVRFGTDTAKEEIKRFELDNVIDANFYAPMLVMTMHKNKIPMLIDNFSYSVYDVPYEYAVKGIYEGATMIKEEEPTRTITVVDKANADVVSTTATGVSKVEFYKDDVLVNTDEDGTDSWSYALANDSYGAHKLEVKVTDTYNEVHSYVRNYTVVEGVKNAASFTENFDGFDAATVTDEELQEAIIANNGEKYLISSTPLVLETRNGSNALKLKADGNTGYIQFKGAPSETGRRVHYYEFDMSSYTAYSSTFYVRGDAYNTSTHGVELFNTQSYLYGTTRIFSNLNNVVRKVRIVLDYNETAPTATISFDGNEWTTVSLADAVAGTGDPALVLNAHKHANASPIYIDNFKYSVYDYPSRFGKGEYEDEIIFESHVNSKGETVYTGPQEFNTYFTNTTGADVTVKNFIVVYDKDGRLVFIYGDDRTNQTDPDTGEVKFKSDQQTYTYPAGVVNQPAHYEWNMGAPEGRSAKIFTYVIDSETGKLDLTPISKFE